MTTHHLNRYGYCAECRRYTPLLDMRLKEMWYRGVRLQVPSGGQDVTQDDIRSLTQQRSQAFLEHGRDSSQYRDVNRQLEQAREAFDEQQRQAAIAREDAEEQARIERRQEQERERREREEQAARVRERQEREERDERREQAPRKRSEEREPTSPPPEREPAEQPTEAFGGGDPTFERARQEMPVALDTGEMVDRASFDRLTDEQQERLRSVGLEQFNREERERFQREQRAFEAATAQRNQQLAALEQLDDFGGIVDAYRQAQPREVPGEDLVTIAQVRELARTAGYSDEDLQELEDFRAGRITRAGVAGRFNAARVRALEEQARQADARTAGPQPPEVEAPTEPTEDAAPERLTPPTSIGPVATAEAARERAAERAEERNALIDDLDTRLEAYRVPENPEQVRISAALAAGDVSQDEIQTVYGTNEVERIQREAQALRTAADAGYYAAPELIPDDLRRTLLLRSAELSAEVAEQERIGGRGRVQAQTERLRADIQTIDRFLATGGILPDVQVRNLASELAQTERGLEELRRQSFRDPINERARLREIERLEGQRQSLSNRLGSAVTRAEQDPIADLRTDPTFGTITEYAQVAPTEVAGSAIREAATLALTAGAGTAVLRGGTAAVRTGTQGTRALARRTGQILRDERGFITAAPERTAFNDVVRQAEQLVRTPNRYQSEADFTALRQSLRNVGRDTARTAPGPEPRPSTTVALTDDQVETLVQSVRQGDERIVAGALQSIARSNEAQFLTTTAPTRPLPETEPAPQIDPDDDPFEPEAPPGEPGDVPSPVEPIVVPPEEPDFPEIDPPPFDPIVVPDEPEPEIEPFTEPEPFREPDPDEDPVTLPTPEPDEPPTPEVTPEDDPDPGETPEVDPFPDVETDPDTVTDPSPETELDPDPQTQPGTAPGGDPLTDPLSDPATQPGDQPGTIIDPLTGQEFDTATDTDTATEQETGLELLTGAGTGGIGDVTGTQPTGQPFPEPSPDPTPAPDPTLTTPTPDPTGTPGPGPGGAQDIPTPTPTGTPTGTPGPGPGGGFDIPGPTPVPSPRPRGPRPVPRPGFPLPRGKNAPKPKEVDRGYWVWKQGFGYRIKYKASGREVFSLTPPAGAARGSGPGSPQRTFRSYGPTKTGSDRMGVTTAQFSNGTIRFKGTPNTKGKSRRRKFRIVRRRRS